MARDRVTLVLLVLVVACVACFTRVAQHSRVELVGRAGWITTDPDTQYQIRRVERALDQGLPPAEFDERMNAPHGARIPWPPYYAALATALVATGLVLWTGKQAGQIAHGKYTMTLLDK